MDYHLLMCDPNLPRFQLYYFHREIGNMDDLTLDMWMENNIPEEYRVVSVLCDKIATDRVIYEYTVVGELK